MADFEYKIGYTIDNAMLTKSLAEGEKAAEASAQRIGGSLAKSFAPLNRDLFGRFMGAGDKLNMSRLVKDSEAFSRSSEKIVPHWDQARHSVSALSSTLILATGQTGSMAIEVLRAATHMGRLVTTTGGLVAVLTAAKASLITIAGSMTAMATLGVGIGAAIGLWFDAKETAKIEERTKKLGELADRMDPLRKATMENAVARGRALPEDVRSAELFGQGLSSDQISKVLAKERDTAQAGIENQERAKEEESIQRRLSEMRQSAADSEERDRQAANDQFKAAREREAADRVNEEESIQNRLRQMREHDDQQKLARIESFNRTLEARREAAQGLAVASGLAKPSQFERDPFLQRIMQAQEKIGDIARTIPGFGIRLGDSDTSSRFGKLESGVSFGAQNEEQRQTKLLQRIADLIAKAINPFSSGFLPGQNGSIGA